MAKSKGILSFVLQLLAWLIIIAPDLAHAQQPAAQPSSAYLERKRELNENVVTIIASGTASPYTIFAEDMRDVLDQSEPGGLRILPILGKGGGNNVFDVMLLKGVDMGIVEQGEVDLARQQEPTVLANVQNRLHYITKLANSEFQLIAQKEYQTLKDLEGKKVNYFKKGSSTEIVCAKIFGTLNIKVEPVYLDQAEANAKLKTREIAAAARFAGAPHNAFTGFKAEDGLHFLPVDPETVPAGDFAKLLDTYSPALLRNDHFPALIAADKPVPTIAGAMLLVVYNWPKDTDRYQRVANFVNQFFTNIEKFKGPGRHPKWKEINLAADVQGWTRFGPAQEWLNRWAKSTAVSTTATTASTSATAPADIRVAFEEFLKTRGGNGKAISPEQREVLFSQFTEWWKTRKASQR